MTTNPEVISWHRVADRLPPTALDVLVHGPSLSPTVWLGYCRDGDWMTCDGFPHEASAITHWAHLPAGPVMKEEQMNG